MTGRTSRREMICDAAIDLAAAGGNHAITHQAIDAHLGLARGSTSYYYRTRQALLSATIRRLTERSRAALVAALPDPETPTGTVADAAAVIAGQIHLLLSARRADVLARYALIPDTEDDDELRTALATCLFSMPLARDLMSSLGAPEPDTAAADLISLLEGLTFDHTFGHRSLHADSATRDTEVQQTIARWLSTLVIRHAPPPRSSDDE